MTPGRCSSCAAWMQTGTLGDCALAPVGYDAALVLGLSMAMVTARGETVTGVRLVTRPEHGCLAWKQRKPLPGLTGYDANGSLVET